MGGQNHYLSAGGFSQYLYHTEGESAVINGLQVKVVAKIDEDNHHSGLPFYSNTSDVYLKIERDGTLIEQAIIYQNRKAVLEFDWGHNHNGKNGHPSFKKGEVHVHELHQIDGKVRRNSKVQPRWMNTEEMTKYGDIIRFANPNAKMR